MKIPRRELKAVTVQVDSALIVLDEMLDKHVLSPKVAKALSKTHALLTGALMDLTIALKED